MAVKDRVNEFIQELLGSGYKAWSETPSLTCWPEDAPKIGVKKHEYVLTQTYKHGDSFVTIYYIFVGYRQPALAENADRVTAYSEPDGLLTIF